MRINTQIDKTDRRIQYINKLDGVDLRKSEVLSRADKSINLLNKNGKIVKRNGWQQKYKLKDAIDFLYEVSFNGIGYILAYSGRRFYLITDSVITDITESAQKQYSIDIDKLKNAYLSIVHKNECYYIFGAGEYLVLGDFGSGIELRSVKKDAYIPTTMVGIMPDIGTVFVKDNSLDESFRGIRYVKTDSGYKQVVINDESPWNSETVYYKRLSSYQIKSASLESENILTPMRKNTLYGVSGRASYKLDVDDIAYDSRNKVIIKALENGDINEYILTERVNYTEKRYPIVGDNLKGRVLTIEKNDEIITCQGLQNGLKTKGKVLFRGENMECYWRANSISQLSWNNAELILDYLNSDGKHIKTTIAKAHRSNPYDSYTVTYNALSINLPDSVDFIIDECIAHGDADKQIYALLPSFVSHLVDSNLTEWGTLDHKKGVLSLIKSAVSPDGGDNIEVIINASNRKFLPSVIDECAFCQEFGVDGNTDRAFVSGCTEYPNCDFASESEDLSYFPIDYVYTFGLDSSPIVGYARLSDDSQAVFKRGMANESNVYIRKGRWGTKSVSIGDNTLTFNSAEFTLIGNYVSNGAIDYKTISYLDGEPVYLNEKGIYELKQISSMTDQYKMSIDIGKCIDNEICDSIQNVHNAVSYRGDYYISVGDKIYIAQSNNYYYEDKTKQYNWWILGEIPSSCIAVISDKLWFGTADGRICTFWDKYTDTYYDAINSGAISFTIGEETAVFNEDLLLSVGDQITVEQELYSVIIEDCSIIDGRIYTDIVLRNGMAVYVDNVGDSGLNVGVQYIVTDFDLSNNSFCLLQNGENASIKGGGFRLCASIKNVPLTIKSLKCTLDASRNDLCKLSYNGLSIIPIKYGDSEFPDSFSGSVIREKAVRALWRTTKSDLGYPDMLKTVHKVGVILGERAVGNVQLVCEARSRMVKSASFGYGTEFYEPNMAQFTFDGANDKEFYTRIKYRDISTLSLLIVSSDAVPFELKGFSIEYALLKRKRGIY